MKPRARCERACMLRVLVNELRSWKGKNVRSLVSSEAASASFGRPEENTAAGIAE